MSPHHSAPEPRSAHMCAAHVETLVQAFLVCSEESTVPFTVRLSYTCSDPYAATVRFPTVDDRHAPTTWTFARSLLEEGQRVTSGEGDVKVVPCGPDYTGLELCSRAGRALILLSAHDLRGFVEATYRKVPAGSEHQFLDIDDDVSRLLGDTH